MNAQSQTELATAISGPVEPAENQERISSKRVTNRSWPDGCHSTTLRNCRSITAVPLVPSKRV